jgi:hypothetical protein
LTLIFSVFAVRQPFAGGSSTKLLSSLGFGLGVGSGSGVGDGVGVADGVGVGVGPAPPHGLGAPPVAITCVCCSAVPWIE